MDPTNPVLLGRRFVGIVFVATIAIFGLAIAQNQGVPLLNKYVSRFTGGRVDTQGEVRVF